MRALLLILLATPALAVDDSEATQFLQASMGQACTSTFDEAGKAIAQPQRFDLEVPTSWGDPQPMTVWQFACSLGAYNASDVFVFWSEFDGMQLASLPAPDLNIVTENPEDPESKVIKLEVIGWRADPWAVNAAFDPKTLTLATHSSWRGLDDAFDTATYLLVDGHFRLTHYEADADYDGKQQPKTLYDAR